MASTGIAASDVDVWGNAMAAAIGFASMEQEASIFAFFSQFETNIFYEGQVGGSGARDTSYSFYNHVQMDFTRLGCPRHDRF